MKKLIGTVLIASTLVLSGCQSTMKKLVHKDRLEVSTQMSATVWLDPVSPDKQTAYLQIRNTSDKQLNINHQIASALAAKGFKIVNDPNKAHYWIQANVLKVGKTNKEEVKGLLSGGYGSMIAGGVVGAQFGSGNGQFAMGAAGALAGAALDAFLEDIMYTIVTDLQISERAAEGVQVQEENRQSNSQGTSGYKTQRSNETTNRKKYQTRVVSTAEKVNLEFEEAKPELEKGLVLSITGIL